MPHFSQKKHKMHDTTDFERLYRDNYSRLYYYALQMVKDDELCRDIINDSFVLVWNKRDDIPTPKLLPYFYRMVHNRCIDHIRKEQAKERYASFYKVFYGVDLGEADYDKDEDERFQKFVTLVLDGMSRNMRTVVQRSFYDNKRYADIAEELGVTVSAVKKQMAKALGIFRSKWKDDG